MFYYFFQIVFRLWHHHWIIHSAFLHWCEYLVCHKLDPHIYLNPHMEPIYGVCFTQLAGYLLPDQIFNYNLEYMWTSARVRLFLENFGYRIFPARLTLVSSCYFFFFFKGLLIGPSITRQNWTKTILTE